MKIKRITTADKRYDLPPGAGSDSIHLNPQYSYAVTLLELDVGEYGTGLSYALGRGTEVVVRGIEALAPFVIGRDLDDIMPRFARFWRGLADEQQLRWIGPHKGAIHMALASVSSALLDAWCRVRQQPLWRLLLEMSPEELIEWVDLCYLDDVLTREEALELLRQSDWSWQGHDLIESGYPAYDTSVGWLGYSLETVVQNCLRQAAAGYDALKMKVGSENVADDVRRLLAVREAVGPEIRLMTDANQRWNVPDAIAAGRALAQADCFWLEEPTHPDDVLGYQRIAREAAPLRLASGECVSNAVLFKNLIQSGGIHFVQADTLRLGGLPEFLGVVLMAKKAGLPVVPHASDMGQIHQHLAVWQAIALGAEPYPIEHISHLRQYFERPAEIEGGRYQLPRVPGASTRLKGVTP